MSPPFTPATLMSLKGPFIFKGTAWPLLTPIGRFEGDVFLAMKPDGTSLAELKVTKTHI